MKKIIFIILIANFISTHLWAQKDKDTLNTEVIEVVKPYEPTISDSFKINEQPEVSKDEVVKDSITYQINSVPVASTFTPTKGKPKGVTKPVRDKLYENFISVGFGNYTSPLIDAYIRTYPTRESEIGFIVKHHSSQGGIKDVRLNDAYSDTKGNLYFKQEDSDKIWKLGLDVNHGMYNWYGLSDIYEFTDEFLTTLDPKQTYMGIGINGELNILESFLKGGTLEMSSFSDSFKSNEQRLRIQPKIEMKISTELINFQFDFDYLKGAYDKTYTDNSQIKYTYLTAGVIPNFQVLRENLTINLGAKLYYLMDNESGVGDFKAYPNVDVSYQLVDEVLTVFTGAIGNLTHNTYKFATSENPYLSPNFKSIPTDEKFKFYGGLKGKLASNMSYLFSGSYSDVKNKPMYFLNQSKINGILGSIEHPYELGNSFRVIYDNAKIISLNGELVLDFSKEFTFGGKVNYNLYNFENEVENWNLPALKTTIYADYHNKKWTGTAKLFMMSERKDREVPYGIMTFAPDDFVVSNGTFIDLNAEMSYTFTDRLSAFAKGNNLLTANYKSYYNYPVQGLQVLAGITYKFDL